MNIQNVRMGVASISFAGNDIGHTLGGVKVTITRKLTDIKVDKYGDSPVDKVVTDEQVKVTMKVAEPVVALLKNALPESEYATGSGLVGTRLGVAAGEGASLRTGAAVLVLHPLNRAVSDFTEDLTVYLAVATASPVINYEVSNQRVFDLEFEALVSEAYVAGRRLAHFGPTNIS